jgi:hypothetical protein
MLPLISPIVQAFVVVATQDHLVPALAAALLPLLLFVFVTPYEAGRVVPAPLATQNVSEVNIPLFTTASDNVWCLVTNNSVVLAVHPSFAVKDRGMVQASAWVGQKLLNVTFYKFSMSNLINN